MKLIIESADLDCTLRQEIAAGSSSDEVIQHVHNCCDEFEPFEACMRVQNVLGKYEIDLSKSASHGFSHNAQGQLIGELVRAAVGLAITPRWKPQANAKDTRHVAYIESDTGSLHRGGSTRVAMCSCGWRGPERATLTVAADDAMTHEQEHDRSKS